MGNEVDWDLLAKHAWTVHRQAYAPYSKLAVGAALAAATGEIFGGCNVENASFGLTICAERAAALAAVAAGFRNFAALVVVSNTLDPVAPCGACRQFLAEFGLSLAIQSIGVSDVKAAWLLSELLPVPFGSSSIP